MNQGGMQLQSETYLFDIIKFDELLSRFQRTLRDIFILKRDFYNLIASGEVDLLQVKKKGENILEKLDMVDEMINGLNKINAMSRRCQELVLVYISVFDMRKSRIK